MEKKIRELYDKKTKVKDLKTIKTITDYLNKYYFFRTYTIKYGTYDINIFNINPLELENIQVRPESVFKINLYLIKSFLKKIIKDGISIEVKLEETSQMQKELDKKINHYSHDAIIEMSNGQKTYQIGFEYNEKNSHNNSRQINNDNSRNINSNMYFHAFYPCYESNNDYLKFVKDVIKDLLTIGCTLKNDKFLLAKMLYLINNNNIDEVDEQEFDLLSDWRKNDEVDFNLFFDSLKPRNDDDEEYTYEEYIEHLSDYDIEIIDNKCKYKDIMDIINMENNDCSQKLLYYRKMTTTISNKLDDACEIIIDLQKKINEKQEFLVPFINEKIKNLHVFNNPSLVKMGIENFNKI